MPENLGDLYIRMRLNLSELETDFLSAERTVTENVRRLIRLMRIFLSLLGDSCGARRHGKFFIEVAFGLQGKICAVGVKNRRRARQVIIVVANDAAARELEQCFSFRRKSSDNLLCRRKFFAPI